VDSRAKRQVYHLPSINSYVYLNKHTPYLHIDKYTSMKGKKHRLGFRGNFLEGNK
jgi:hypothetical protein